MSRLEKCDLCEGRGTDALHRWCATCKGSGKVFSFVAEPTAPPAPFVPVAAGSIPPVRRWECGKCGQEDLAAKGLPIGEVIPEHFRTCPKRTPGLPTVPIMPDAKIKASNPKDAIGSKKPGLSVLSMPVCFEVAAGMLEGACKYRRHNYRVIGVRASVYYDATLRHLASWWEGEDIDTVSGIHHVSKAIASLFVLRDAMLAEKCSDDRPPPAAKAWLEAAQKITDEVLAKYPNPLPPYTKDSKEPT